MEEELSFQHLFAVKGCYKVQMVATLFEHLVHFRLLHLLVVDTDVPQGESSTRWASNKPVWILGID